MRVEITDRALWIERVKAALQHIDDRRAQADARYEAEWAARYNSRGPVRRFFCGPSSEKPTKNGWDDLGVGWGYYPSIYAWGDKDKLNRVLHALQSDGTGAIYITGDELRAIGT